MFVKINMDGVPIGRKVDLSAFASYEKLSFAVDELFRGLLAGTDHHNSVVIVTHRSDFAYYKFLIFWLVIEN